MSNTVTVKEIEEFLDRCLNYEKKEYEEKLYGKKRHRVGSNNVIYLDNDVRNNYWVGGIGLRSDGTIYAFQIDSGLIPNRFNPNVGNPKRYIYVGTDMEKETEERFIGKKLIR